MKILFRDVIVEEVGGSFKGLSANYVASDSDGSGNVGVDSGSISPSPGFEPTYSSLAQVEGLTQTQIYNDFYPAETIEVVVGYELDLEISSDLEMDSASGLPTLDIREESEMIEVTETHSVGNEWLRGLRDIIDIKILR